MRIIIFGTFIDYQIQLANYLSRNNDVMLVLPITSIEKEYSDNIEKNVDLQLLGKVGKHKYHPEYCVRLKDFLRYVKKFRPDIIHIQLGYGAITPLMFLTFKVMKYHIVTTFHDIDAHLGEDSLWKRFSRYWIRKYSDKIIVHGEKLKKDMIEKYNISADKIHNTVIGMHEVQPYKNYIQKNFEEEKDSILFFGRIFEYKGLNYLIKAEPLIKKELPLIKIVIAGTGEDFKKYESMMINKDSYKIYNYHISYKEGAELFQKCNLVVLPYIEASQSGVIPVAYSFKKPVIVTDVGALSEIVDNNVTGLIVPPRNSNDLARAIIKLLKDNELRKQMGENAYIKLYKDMAWERIAEKTSGIYKEIL